MPYNKPFLSVPDQIALLKARGMDVGAAADAEALFTQFGYYRLSGYWHPMRKWAMAPVAGGVVYEDDFQQGSTLTQAIHLAKFDEDLRAHFLRAIERIEIGLRVRVALLLGARGAMTHRDPHNFYPRFSTPDLTTGASPYTTWLDRVDEHEARSKEQFAVHIRERYGLPFPLWVSIEVWDFGMMSRLVGGMTIADQKALGAPLGMSRTHVIPSWLRAINHIRNICAHYSRLWNRSPADQPMPPKAGENPLLDHLADDNFAQTKLYAVAAVMQYLLRTIDPAFATEWANLLKAHFATFPAKPPFVVGQSGFPGGWDALPLWN
jgi:abortive infection bacteriophage resistance protein